VILGVFENGAYRQNNKFNYNTWSTCGLRGALFKTKRNWGGTTHGISYVGYVIGLHFASDIRNF
jgi:hypothetical protein